MNIQEFTFTSYNTKIFGRWAQLDEVKGVVVLVHGFGEHSGRYLESVVPMLLKSSLAVVLYDNIGHGKSGGKRGHCPGYDTLMDILNQVIKKANSMFPGIPLFLYGHSMGGNIVLNYAIRRETGLKGVIATSPYLRLAFQPPKWKIVLGKVMLRLLPSITLSSGLDPKGISRISEEVEKYRTDPLVHDKVSPMFSFPIMDAGEWAIGNAHKLKVDTLLLHGTSDGIIDYRGTEEFHQNSTQTTLRFFEGGYHELHHDLCKEEMLGVIRGWLQNALE